VEPSSALAEAVRRGVDALKTGRALDAVAALEPHALSEELARADDLQDVRARVCSLLAQAMLEAERPEDALRWVREAVVLHGRVRDSDRTELRELEDRVLAAVARARQRALELPSRARLATTAVDTLLRGVTDPRARCTLLIQKANADLDAQGESAASSAAALAAEALALAIGLDDVREEVLARLTLARALPGTAAQELALAWRRAERASEFNLVGAVAKSAEEAGVVLPQLFGPR
jgi:hypothetical protein